MTFGQKLYTLREERGWSQDELAEKADVSRQTVSNWENDKVQIDAEKLKRLSEVFGVGMDELYAADTVPVPQEGQKKSKRNTLAVMLVLIGLAVCSLVLAVIGLCRADTGQTSSAITITGTAGLCIALAASVVVLAVCTVYLIKFLKKK